MRGDGSPKQSRSSRHTRLNKFPIQDPHRRWPYAGHTTPPQVEDEILYRLQLKKILPENLLEIPNRSGGVMQMSENRGCRHQAVR